MSNPTAAAERLDARTVRGELADRVVLIGARRDARRFIRSLKGEARDLPQIVGFVEAGHAHSELRRPHNRHIALHPQTDPIPVLGRIDHLQSVLDRSGATVVLIAVSRHRAHSYLGPHLARLNRPGVSVRWVMVDDDIPSDHSPREISTPFDNNTESAVEVQLGAPRSIVPQPFLPPISSSSFPRWLTRPVDRAGWTRAAKRLFDIAIATLALIALSPLFLVVGLLVWASSGWPIFYTRNASAREDACFG